MGHKMLYCAREYPVWALSNKCLAKCPSGGILHSGKHKTGRAFCGNSVGACSRRACFSASSASEDFRKMHVLFCVPSQNSPRGTCARGGTSYNNAGLYQMTATAVLTLY